MSKRSRDFVIIGLSVILYLFVARFWNPPAPVTPGGDTVVLGVQARIVLGLLCVAILFWITEVVPFGITALLVLILMPVLGATEGLIPGNGSEPVHGLKQGLDMLAAWGFGNRIIFFFLGVFLLTAAIKESGLGQRMAVNLLIRVGTETRRVIFSFLLLGTLLSMWITDMAVAALMLPLGVNLLKSAELEPGKTQFGKALMIACAWGAIFGGVGTPAGCGPNPIAIAYLEELAGVHVSFPDWMKLGVPVSLLLAPVGWIVLILTFPPEMKYLPITKEKLKNQLHEIGPMNQGEINTLIVFVAVVALWVFKDVIRSLIGIALPMEWVSMAGGVALFIPGLRVLTWNEAESAIPWGAIVLVMASLALGMAAYKSGAARWMAWVLLGWIQGDSARRTTAGRHNGYPRDQGLSGEQHGDGNHPDSHFDHAGQ